MKGVDKASFAIILKASKFLHSFIHSFIHSFLIHSFIHSFVRSFIRSFIHSFILHSSLRSFISYAPAVYEKDQSGNGVKGPGLKNWNLEYKILPMERWA